MVLDITYTDEVFGYLEHLVAYEAERRLQEEKYRPAKLSDFEKQYFGKEVGFARRAFEARMKLILMRYSGTLLDYGCGGHWWKNAYYPLFQKVYCVEVNRSALLDIGRHFRNVELLYTRNGLIRTKNIYVDVVLSSSVIGYILPFQADLHLKCCYEALKNGGFLILTRIESFNIKHFVRGERLKVTNGLSFSYAYKKWELKAALKRTGFTKVEYFPLGVWFPFIPHRYQQKLYRYFPRLMTDILPRFLPFAKAHHMFVAQKS